MINAMEDADKETDFVSVYGAYVNDIYRLCFSFMKNYMDAEDAVQETFLKYLHRRKSFASEEHKKAWLIVTATNQCKDMLKHWWRKRRNLDDYTELVGKNDSEIDEVMSIIMKLPEKYKTPVYLYYYESYNSREIAKLLRKPESTIRTYLQKAKKMLRQELE